MAFNDRRTAHALCAIAGALLLLTSSVRSQLASDVKIEMDHEPKMKVVAALVAGTEGKHNVAIHLLQQALPMVGDDLRARAFILVQSCFMRLEAGQLNPAKADCDESIRSVDNDPDAYWARGTLEMRRGAFRSAIADFDKAEQLESGNWEVLLNRGISRLEAGDPAGAARDMTAAMESQPDKGVIYYNRGNARRFVGEYAGALEDYSKAVELGPREPLNLVNRGTLYGEMGQLMHAISDLDAALALDPTHDIALENRARSYIELELFNQAQVDLETLEKLDPGNLFVRNLLFALRHDRDALALEIATNNPAILYQRAVAKLSYGMQDSALKDVSRAIEFASDHAEMRSFRAVLLFRSGDLNGATADLEEAVRLEPENTKYQDQLEKLRLAVKRGYEVSK